MVDFGLIYDNLFPFVSLHEDLHTQGTHGCMQIILKTRFQFPHWVMKNVLFPKVITIFKLYLFWFKMEQTLPGFDVDSLHVGFRFGMFPQPVWLRRSHFIP